MYSLSISPPYSPDFNPIEKCGQRSRCILRKGVASIHRTYLDLYDNMCKKLRSLIRHVPAEINRTMEIKGGCYIATFVYGSYDCSQVWTLRRFRDNTLDETWYGRFFSSVIMLLVLH